MITVHPNRETTDALRAQQVSDACREGRAWAMACDRTEDEVIGWAAVVLRDGPTRMGWTPEQTRLVAQAYLEGWHERPTPAERIHAAGRTLGGLMRTIATLQQAMAQGVAQGSRGTATSHRPDGAPGDYPERPTRYVTGLKPNPDGA